MVRPSSPLETAYMCNIRPFDRVCAAEDAGWSESICNQHSFQFVIRFVHFNDDERVRAIRLHSDAHIRHTPIAVSLRVERAERARREFKSLHARVLPVTAHDRAAMRARTHSPNTDIFAFSGRLQLCVRVQMRTHCNCPD